MSFLSQTEIGIGTWAWGEGQVWSFGKDYNAQDLKEAFRSGTQAGIRLFDTAEVYGKGQSESYLGEFLKEKTEGKVYIATKFAPYPWVVTGSQVLRALKASLRRLGLPSVDLYQMHWPSPHRTMRAWMEPLAQAVKEGLATEVGVSNFKSDQMLRAQEALSKHGVPLASNQVQFSLVRRKNEFNGLLEECKKSGVKFISYSPLGMGMLSGKYSPQNPPSGPRRLFYLGQLQRILPLVEKLKALGQAHGGKTPNQVALNWLICKGTLPIPGAKTAVQAKENAGALGWRLNPAEVKELDEASQDFKG
jgi:aryl-alcohol dehydrogenase-like predicted oxidoreductase